MPPLWLRVDRLEVVTGRGAVLTISVALILFPHAVKRNRHQRFFALSWRDVMMKSYIYACRSDSVCYMWLG